MANDFINARNSFSATNAPESKRTSPASNSTAKRLSAFHLHSELRRDKRGAVPVNPRRSNQDTIQGTSALKACANLVVPFGEGTITQSIRSLKSGVTDDTAHSSARADHLAWVQSCSLSTPGQWEGAGLAPLFARQRQLTFGRVSITIAEMCLRGFDPFLMSSASHRVF
jgi:hypothetical protein